MCSFATLCSLSSLIMAVLSANIASLVLLEDGMSLIKMLNNVGLNALP